MSGSTSITIINPASGEVLNEASDAYVGANGHRFPLANGAYRFVPDANYTENFGFQWNKFQKTQIDDAATQLALSEDRFFAVSGWKKQGLAGQKVLEVGSGAGRFTQVVLNQTQAELYSVDYSNAVEANFKNNGPHPRLHLFQASIYDLPFAPGQFDKVFCFGVLQHTPSFKQSVKALTEMVKPGGELVVDFYPIKGWYTKLTAKYLLRPITKRLSHPTLFRLIDSTADFWIASSKLVDRIGLGKLVNRFLPICDIKNTLPPNLSPKELREWVVLDTFDMFSPEYDQPQRLSTVAAWFTEFGMKQTTPFVRRYAGDREVYGVSGIK
jgi:2-polyprenyl-3-methyl-5-hydroxy-6-metoxy-1,4-benzoquinol methylase